MQPGNSHRGTPGDGAPPRLGHRAGRALLTPRQSHQASHWLAQVEACGHWHGDLPVLLLERCWLRLTAVGVEQLARHLPPDLSWDAPELAHYRQLLERGLSPLSAEQLCWEEFGQEACHQAQRRLWQAQEQGNRGWTLQRYLDLLRHYRLHLELGGPPQVPLLVLARSSEAPQASVHELVWLGRGRGDLIQPMRHTCA